MTDPCTSDPLGWRRSTYSLEGNCVELAALPDGRVGMRNSRHPEGAMAAFTRGQIDALLRGIKAGEFDDLG